MINTDYLHKCIANLSLSFELLSKQAKAENLYEIYRSAAVKEFELILEQSGKLLKKTIRPYFATNKAVDKLAFKEIFKHAHKFNLLNTEEVSRWFRYRDSRNETAHNYGDLLAEHTLELVPEFIIDSKNLVKTIDATTRER